MGPEHEEANASLSPTTTFFYQLEEDFFPIHFNFTVDSDGDFLHLHSPFQIIAHALRLDNPQPSFTPITQIGQSTALIHPHHSGLGSPRRERPQ